VFFLPADEDVCRSVKWGLNMPVFSLENAFSRPPAPITPAGGEPRGIIIQLFDRIAEARMQRDAQAFCRMKRSQNDICAPPDTEC
jgi:hypothetical protein